MAERTALIAAVLLLIGCSRGLVEVTVRHRVARLTPRIAAARSLSPPTASSTRRACNRFNSSREIIHAQKISGLCNRRHRGRGVGFLEEERSRAFLADVPA